MTLRFWQCWSFVRFGFSSWRLARWVRAGLLGSGSATVCLMMGLMVCLVLWPWMSEAQSPNSSFSVSTTATVSGVQQPNRLTLMYHTDLNGQWRSFSCPKAGETANSQAGKDMANLLGLIQHVRKQHKAQGMYPPALFSTGNMFAPDRSSRYMLYHGGRIGAAFLAKQLKRFDYDLSGLGSFAFWTETQALGWMLSAAAKEGLRFSLANLDKVPATHPLAALQKHPQQVAPSTFVLQRGRWRIGVFHLGPESMPQLALDEGTRSITLGAPASVAQERVKLLRETHKVDVVVVLSELEQAETRGSVAWKLAGEVEGIDLILSNGMASGQSTGRLTHYRSDGSVTTIVGSQPQGTQLGLVHLHLQREQDKTRIARVHLELRSVDDNVFDASLRNELQTWEKTYCRNWGAPLGQGQIRTKDGMTEEQFRRYVLQVARMKGRAEVAFFPNTTMVSDGFPIQKYITTDDLYRAIPREESLALIKLQGKDLTALIGTSDSPGPNSKPFSFVGIDGSSVNGRKIEDNLYYYLVTTRFVAMGKHPKLEKTVIRSVQMLTTPNGSPLLLRTFLVEHFHSHLFQFLQREPDSSDLAGPTTIPHHGELQRLDRLPTWTFNASLQLGFSALTIEPININVVYTQHDELNGGFYEKFNVQGQAQMSLRMESTYHLWLTEVNLNYAVDTSIQWSKGPPAGPIDPRIYQESNDQLTFKTQYHWHFLKSVIKNSKWEVASPFVEALVETETTTTQRPDLSSSKFFETTGSTEVFHHFETRGKLGLSFQYASVITMRVGGTWRKEWALGLLLKDPVNVPARVNLDSSVGIAIDYEIDNWNFATIGKSPLTLKSKAEYNLTFVIGTDKQGLSLHDFRWQNELRIGIVTGLFVAIGFRMLLFRGIFRPLNNNPEKKFIHGPLAFRIDPSLSIGFQWGVRHQTR